MQSNRMTMKAAVKSVEVDELGYIWAVVYGPLLGDGDSVQFDAAFRPEEVPPGMTPLGLASLALGHKVEIDLAKCGDSSFAVVALRLSEKTQAARVLRLAAEMMPWVPQGDWLGALCRAGLTTGYSMRGMAERRVFNHLEVTGRKNSAGTSWNAFRNAKSFGEVNQHELLKEQIAALMTVADQLDEENDDGD